MRMTSTVARGMVWNRLDTTEALEELFWAPLAVITVSYLCSYLVAEVVGLKGVLVK